MQMPHRRERHGRKTSRGKPRDRQAKEPVTAAAHCLHLVGAGAIGGDGIGFPHACWAAARTGFNYFIAIALLPLVFQH